jgi:hypothetical protein
MIAVKEKKPMCYTGVESGRINENAWRSTIHE